MAVAGSVGPSGIGPPSSSCISATPPLAGTGRSPMPRWYSLMRAATAASSSSVMSSSLRVIAPARSGQSHGFGHRVSDNRPGDQNRVGSAAGRRDVLVEVEDVLRVEAVLDLDQP